MRMMYQPNDYSQLAQQINERYAEVERAKLRAACLAQRPSLRQRAAQRIGALISRVGSWLERANTPGVTAGSEVSPAGWPLVLSTLTIIAHEPTEQDRERV